MILLAGHETTATTLQVSIIMLALRPELQIKLQEEVNRILGDREPDYERDYQALAEGWCGAIMVGGSSIYHPSYLYSILIKILN